jgi:hypothetical protein
MSGRIVVGVMAAAIAGAVAAGLVAAGSPAKARERRFDDRRVEDLTAIGRAVDHRHSVSGRLPETLVELAQDWTGLELIDPATTQPYEYAIVDGARYQLCAVFHQRSTDGNTLWQHGAGRQCFTRRVQREVR